MIRKGRALFISFIIHGSIAAAAIMGLQAFKKEKPGEEARMCIALAQFAKPVARAPEPKPLPEKVQPKPPKKEPQPKPKPKKKVEKPKIEKPIIKEEAPVAVEEEVVEETVPEPPEVAEEVKEEEVTAVAEAETPAPEVVPELSAGERYLQEHIALITKLLQENLYYPHIARKRGITGEVMVAFVLQENGIATAINVMSGERELLNRAAVTTIERLSGRFPKPSEPITLHVPIHYELK